MDWESKATKKHIAEASVYDAILLGAGRDANYRIYRLKCQHEQEIHTGKMRTGGFRCNTCLKNKLITEASVYDATLLGAGKNAMYRIYELKCGHEQEIQLSNMRIGDFKCNTCLNNQHIAEASVYEAILLGAGRNRANRTYRLKCKHEQEIKVGHMKCGNFKCNTCIKNRHIADAKAQEATLLGAGRSKGYRTYRLKCKHEQEVQLQYMKTGGFQCNTCEDTARTLPAFAYLLLIECFGEQWLKFGFAKNVSLRSTQYKLPSDAVVTEIAVVPFPTGKSAEAFEVPIHRKFKRKKLSQKRAKELGMANGFTECYPVTMLDTLAAELAA